PQRHQLLRAFQCAANQCYFFHRGFWIARFQLCAGKFSNLKDRQSIHGARLWHFRVAHACRVLAKASSPSRTFIRFATTGKDCFGETPKSARETRALSRNVRESI